MTVGILWGGVSWYKVSIEETRFVLVRGESFFQIVSRGDQKRGVNEFTGGRKTMEDIIISATLGCNMNEILIKY